MKSIIKYSLIIALGMVFSLPIAAQNFEKKHLVIKTGETPHAGRVRVLSIENVHDTTVEVSLINEYDDGRTPKKIKRGEKYTCDITLNVIKAKAVNESKEIEVLRSSTPDSSKKQHTEQRKEDSKQASSSNREEQKKNAASATLKDTTKIIAEFIDFVDTLRLVSEQKRIKDSTVIAKHLEYMNLASTDKKAYIETQKLQDYVISYQDTINSLRDSVQTFINDFCVEARLSTEDLPDECKIKMVSIIEKRIADFENMLLPLSQIVNDTRKNKSLLDWKVLSVLVGVILLIIILIIWYRSAKKSQMASSKHNMAKKQEMVDDPPLIVLGEAKSPALKKQSLDDVYDNNAYLPINSKDFCGDSCIRTLYVKNSCIKDIYNMYANDLRNPDNPKEDGCMVLGRWVQDDASQLYDVSLEYIVLPGDDAKFSEYELNFGGKIKLKVSDKLRKLRRETGLQYDLTCWVHSHPGLGVFFSNSDNNVQMQLKHPDHPGFLTAFVIDILTPQQETGIFTFKQDGEVNSKNDITKLYSLEEMYKWAIESERRSFDSNDYYDTLAKVQNRFDSCHGIQLSNGAIIDMTFLASNSNGFMGFVQGYIIEKGGKMHCITTTVSKSENVANAEKLGCFVVASHCSIPSIRKVVLKNLNSIHFVLVYTAADGLLTSIPVVNQDLCTSEEYYGEQKLEDLKIWTRRRR